MFWCVGVRSANLGVPTQGGVVCSHGVEPQSTDEVTSVLGTVWPFLFCRVATSPLCSFVAHLCGRQIDKFGFFLKRQKSVRKTSLNDGIGPSPPPFDLCSNSDAANARAAVQASIVDHRSRQACSALFRNTGLSERARAAARRRRKVEVSADQRPPTSPARTTNFALLVGPTNSRYVRSFRRRAASRAIPSTLAARALGEPSQ